MPAQIERNLPGKRRLGLAMVYLEVDQGVLLPAECLSRNGSEKLRQLLADERLWMLCSEKRSSERSQNQRKRSHDAKGLTSSSSVAPSESAAVCLWKQFNHESGRKQAG
jgi:hypothetical protein